MFIVFEGIDGAGSSTHTRLLTEKLESMGYSVYATKEPTADGPIGKLIREILQHKHSVGPETLQMLFCADRSEHVRTGIMPALEAGQVVICDRYVFSTLAYGSLEIDDITWLKKLNESFPKPDLTFYLKVTPSVSLERIEGRGSHFELFEQDDKLRRIGEAYETLIQEDKTVHVIDATQPLDEVTTAIWSVAHKHF